MITDTSISKIILLYILKQGENFALFMQKKRRETSKDRLAIECNNFKGFVGETEEGGEQGNVVWYGMDK